MPCGVAAALARGGWLDLPTLRNLVVCSRGTLAEGGTGEHLSSFSGRFNRVRDSTEPVCIP
jgi:hypothetical protein